MFLNVSPKNGRGSLMHQRVVEILAWQFDASSLGMTPSFFTSLGLGFFLWAVKNLEWMDFFWPVQLWWPELGFCTAFTVFPEWYLLAALGTTSLWHCLRDFSWNLCSVAEGYFSNPQNIIHNLSPYWDHEVSAFPAQNTVPVSVMGPIQTQAP